MDYLQINKMNVTLSRQEAEKGLREGCAGFHESILRSFHIVQKVKWLLEQGTKPEVVLDLIALMENPFLPEPEEK